MRKSRIWATSPDAPLVLRSAPQGSENQSCRSLSILLAPNPNPLAPAGRAYPVYLPIQQHQLPVDREASSYMRLLDAFLNIGQRVLVVPLPPAPAPDPLNLAVSLDLAPSSYPQSLPEVDDD